MATKQTLSSATDPNHIATTCAVHNLTVSQFTLLRSAAVSAKALAYCPYSRFRVGAALLSADGRSVVTGANVENAAYPVGTCAERVAMGKAVTLGAMAAVEAGDGAAAVEEEGPKPIRGFKAVAVSTDISPPASPCGMCRQFIREFCSLEMPIIMFDNKDQYVVMKLGELLPMSFGPDALPPPGAPGAQG